jgi:chromosome segregation ATPase
MTAATPKDAELSRDVDALRERFTQTQELYREVCALLFFRYGITPTANKLYQLVRKGSMSAPAGALSTFWEDLREKSRIRIEHPDMPEALKDATAELVATLWVNAQDAAHSSLAAFRDEAQETVLQAKAATSAAQAERDTHKLAAERVIKDLDSTNIQLSEVREELAGAHAAIELLHTQLDAAKRENSDLQHHLKEARREFSAELDKLRSSAQLAEERSRSTEKRMLMEVDRERTASAKRQKELETLNTGLLRTVEQHRQELGLLQQRLGDSRQKNGQLEGTLQAVAANLDRTSTEEKKLQTQLSKANTQVATLKKQVSEVRQRLKKAKTDKPSEGRRASSSKG